MAGRACCCNNSGGSGGTVEIEQVVNTMGYVSVEGIGSFTLPANAKMVSIAVHNLGDIGSVTLNTGFGAVPLYQGQVITFQVVSNQDILSGTFDLQLTHIDDIVSMAYML